ncbi:hypothetical protein KKF34_15115 [Myxococcota bacterium]|nr:hypothetical protein [Myxococcota bacterium]MBU1380352.1 hypothetical protein [Myxococcota bacterium]MBU1498207.1 hypothetical protein [Myxococcota bacterium]
MKIAAFLLVFFTACGNYTPRDKLFPVPARKRWEKGLSLIKECSKSRDNKCTVHGVLLAYSVLHSLPWNHWRVKKLTRVLSESNLKLTISPNTPVKTHRFSWWNRPSRPEGRSLESEIMITYSALKSGVLKMSPAEGAELYAFTLATCGRKHVKKFPFSVFENENQYILFDEILKIDPLAADHLPLDIKSFSILGKHGLVPSKALLNKIFPTDSPFYWIRSAAQYILSAGRSIPGNTPSEIFLKAWIAGRPNDMVKALEQMKNPSSVSQRFSRALLFMTALNPDLTAKELAFAMGEEGTNKDFFISWAGFAREKFGLSAMHLLEALGQISPSRLKIETQSRGLPEFKHFKSINKNEIPETYKAYYCRYRNQWLTYLKNAGVSADSIDVLKTIACPSVVNPLAPVKSAPVIKPDGSWEERLLTMFSRRTSPVDFINLINIIDKDWLPTYGEFLMSIARQDGNFFYVAALAFMKSGLWERALYCLDEYGNTHKDINWDTALLKWRDAFIAYGNKWYAHKIHKKWLLRALSPALKGESENHSLRLNVWIAHIRFLNKNGFTKDARTESAQLLVGLSDREIQLISAALGHRISSPGSMIFPHELKLVDNKTRQLYVRLLHAFFPWSIYLHNYRCSFEGPKSVTPVGPVFISPSESNIINTSIEAVDNYFAGLFGVSKSVALEKCREKAINIGR